MSTTVTYKGNTLATVSNNTKTLKTAGKYMEGDVILTDSSLAPPTIQSLSITPSESAQTFNASGVDGYKPVSVSAISSTYVGSGIDRRGGSDITIGITTTYDINYKKGYYDNNGSKSILFNTLSNPSISIDSTGLITSSLTLGTSGPYKAQTVTATEQLTLRDSDDLTVSGATVTAPAGYYAEAASKSVTTMTLPTSAAASATSGYTSKATISRSTSDQYINIASGYNSAGGYYKISAVTNGSATPAASISGTSATITTGTNTITLTKTVSNTPQVSAGYVSSGTAGNSSVSLTASVIVNPTPTVSGATVTIPAGYYTDSTTKSVTSGSAGTPTATKGTVSNHSISITPSVTNTTGYITGGTKTGTAVTVSASELVSGSETKTLNGTYDVTNLAELVVNVSSSSPTIQSLSITPSTSEQTFNSSSVDGYKPVTVAAMPAITLPTAVSTTSSGTSKATLTLTGGTRYLNIPTGYNSTAQYYTLSVANGSATGPSSLSGTSATVSTGTNTLTLTKTGVSTTPTVSAGYVSSATASTATVTLTASVTTKAAATITPGTTNQTIASGTYLTGTQTIAGDADLVASNIVNGVQIFGVTGNVVLQNYYTGSSAPSSSTGSNGDLYLQS